jgi:protein-disulfide isomerase
MAAVLPLIGSSLLLLGPVEVSAQLAPPAKRAPVGAVPEPSPPPPPPSGQAPGPPPRPVRTGPDAALTYAVPIAGAPLRGTPDAKVTIVMFGEFKCPYCARAYETMKDLEQRYGTDVRLVFHHYIVHAPARPMAVVGAAAAAQGKFWDYADRIWTSDWRALDDAGARQFAIDVGCAADALDAFIASGQADAVVDADIALAGRFGVAGTPSFFVNGRSITGARPIDGFIAIIDEEKAKSEAWLLAQPKALPAKPDRKARTKKAKKKGAVTVQATPAPAPAGPDPYQRVLSDGLPTLSP